MRDMAAHPASTEADDAQKDSLRDPFWVATHYVYVLVDPRNDQVRYVGCTREPEKRFRAHCHTPGDATAAWVAELVALSLLPKLVIVDQAGGFYRATAIEERLIYEYRRFHGGILNRTDPVWIKELDDAAKKVRQWLLQMLKAARRECGFYQAVCKRRKPRRDSRVVLNPQEASA